MQTVRGYFENGVARLTEPISGHEGQQVLVTFLDSERTAAPADAGAWASLENLIEECACETGVSDRQRVAQEIAEFAAAHAGSEMDLDQSLETAALQALSEDER